MDTDIYRAVRLAYRLGRQDQQRSLEHRLRKNIGSEEQAKQLSDLAAGMTDELVDFSAIIRAAEEGSTPIEAVNGAAKINSKCPRSLTELEFRHAEICPRISDTGSECLACEFAQHLKRSQDRHIHYLNGIRDAIGDDRDKRSQASRCVAMPTRYGRCGSNATICETSSRASSASKRATPVCESVQKAAIV